MSPDDPHDDPTTTPTDASHRFARRDYLRAIGALGAVAAAGASPTAAACDPAEGGPPAESPGSGWSVAFEDTFADGLDESTWASGFGWGTRANYSPSVMVPENVDVADGRLVLDATPGPDGAYHTGAVNTKDRLTFAPPCYIEAKLSPMGLGPGCTSAFWSKPNTEAWPPEIDFMENPTARPHQTMHNIHYSASGQPGDGATHAKVTNGSHDYAEPAAAGDHVYGCLWTADEIAHYVDGDLLGRTTDATVTQAVAAGAPFYMMLNVLVGGWPPGEVPPTDEWADHDTALEADWVRVWAADEIGPCPAPPEDDGTTDEPSDSGPDLPHRIVIDGRAHPDTPTTYEFTTSGQVAKTDAGGTISINPFDEVTGPGVTGRVIGGRDAYDFDGRLTGFSFNGPADVAVSYDAVGAEPPGAFGSVDLTDQSSR